MQIGFLGTGLMGAPMVERLHQAGYNVTAWNRTAAKLTSLRLAGVPTAESPQAAIAPADLVILMLTDAAAIAQTLLAQPDALRGKTVLQMGTIAPAESRSVAERVVAAGSEYLESPVLGSIPQVHSGDLLLMVGATPEQFERWQPLLGCFGSAKLMGPVGAAAAVKLAMNQLIGTLTAAFAMSLALVQREGIDIEAFMDIVRASALYAPTFDKKLGRMRDRNFTQPNFPTKHLLKDLRLFVRAAEEIDARVAEAALQVARKAVEMDLGEADYSAVFAAIDSDGDWG